MSRRLTDEQALSAPDLFRNGRTWQQIGDAFGVSRNAIQRLFGGKTYRELQDRIQEKLADARALGRGRARVIRTDGKRVCTQCERLLSETSDQFPQHHRRGHLVFAARCRDCKKQQNRTRYIESKLRALRHYSGGPPACRCCGESAYEFLTFDHIDGGGRAHRAALKRGKGGVSAIHVWLENAGYPRGYRVLCLNCNGAHGFFGYCPHVGRPGDSLIARLIE